MYNEVMSVGQKYGIRNAGYYALRSLRIEKFFAFWGQDLDPFTTPLECGREFRVKFDKVCSQFLSVGFVFHKKREKNVLEFFSPNNSRSNNQSLLDFAKLRLQK